MCSATDDTFFGARPKWDPARLKGDTAALASVRSNTFIFTTPEGRVRTNAEM